MTKIKKVNEWKWIAKRTYKHKKTGELFIDTKGLIPDFLAAAIETIDDNKQKAFIIDCILKMNDEYDRVEFVKSYITTHVWDKNGIK
jgi:hypothetical protein